MRLLAPSMGEFRAIVGTGDRSAANLAQESQAQLRIKRDCLDHADRYGLRSPAATCRNVGSFAGVWRIDMRRAPD